MRKSLVLFVLVLLTFSWGFSQQTTAPAQTANCTQVLRLARAVYEQGRLHELETLLDGCLKGEVGSTNGFATVQERVDAYRLLCLSYIYLEEPAKADQAMLGLLDADHFFVLNPTDPAEFQALYKTFRTEPIFSYGVKAGANYTMSHITQNYYVWANAKGEAKYSGGINFSVGAFIEKELFPKKNEKSFLRWTTIRFEPFFHIKAFKIKNPLMEIYKTDPGDGVTAVSSEVKSVSNWLDLNINLRYRFNHESTWDPYFGLGPGMTILLASKVTPAKVERAKLQEGSATVTSDSYSGPEIDAKSAFNSIGYSLTALYGVNKRFGAFYINAELRYQYGLNNLISPTDRFVTGLTDEYGVYFNDFNQSSILMVFGITVPNFQPKKLSKRK
jgi:hypothetical protein